jgi:PIN domain
MPRFLEVYVGNISFFLPETAYAEAEEHLAALVVKRSGDPSKALTALRAIVALVTTVGNDLYRDFEAEARKAARRTRSGGLADSSGRPGSWVSDLDRRHRLLWMWRRHLDVRQHRYLSSPVGPASDPIATQRS